MTDNSSRRWSPIALHGLAFAGFALLAWLLAAEAQRAPPRSRAVELALAGGAGALSLLSAFAALALARAGAMVPIRTRAAAGQYLQALLAALVLCMAGARVVSSRPALAAFSAAASAWIIALVFGLVPRLFICPHGIVDILGRRLPFDRITWFYLRPVRGEPERFTLECGGQGAVLLRARLAEDGAKVRRALRAHGAREQATS
jgi:hypothetical protein